jgi:FtsH-binding integral membrane protein
MNRWGMHNLLSVLAIVMLLGVFAPIFANFPAWPYAYFQFMNWVVAIAALMVLNEATRNDKTVLVLVFGLVAIIFNPLAPFYLSPDIWQILDLATALLFGLSLWLVKKSA